MTGKELKQFAEQLHDAAIIEIEDPNSYRGEWKPLDIEKIRATHIVRPLRTLAHVCNLEDIKP